MSPMIDLQQRYRELGRIRLGDTVERTNRNGKTVRAPRKLSEFRLTTASAEILAAAAEVYGGEVKVWTDAPTEGRQYELLTGTDRLDVLVPPGQVLSQHWELWSGGGCERRCDGQAQVDGSRCLCPVDIDARIELSKQGKACRPTTRLSVVLPRIPDIGVWRIETHGVNAAVEIPGTVSILEKALASGVLVPAQLRLDQRTSKKDGQTRHFVVPVIELPTITTQALLSAEGIAAIGPGQERAPVTPAPRGEIAAPAPPAQPAAPTVEHGGDAAPSTASPPKVSGGGVHDESQPEGERPGSAGSHGMHVASSQALAPPAAPTGSLPPLPDEIADAEIVGEDDFDREALKNRKADLKDRLRALPADLAKLAVAKRDEKGIAKVDAIAWDESERFLREVLVPVEKDAKARAASVARACKSAGLEEDDERHALIAYCTEGAVSSAKALTEEQAAHVIAAAKDVKDGALVMIVSEDGTTFLPGGTEEA